jgi:urease accessory protein
MLNNMKMSTRLTMLRAFLMAALVLLPSFAYAHVGAGETDGFLHGLTHPSSGLDHVCAMLAVGLWAAQMGGRSVWVVPLTFVGVMALGGMLPMLGIDLPFVEQGIVLSVLLLGVLIAASVRRPLLLSSGMVGLFALWHGHAHGAEMPELASGIGYTLGFMLATALLHVIGIAFGLGMQRLPILSKVEWARERVVHFAGAGIALCGVYLAVA